MDDYPKMFTQAVNVPNYAPREVRELEVESMIKNLSEAIAKEEIRIEKHEGYTEYKMQFYLATPKRFWEMVQYEADKMAQAKKPQ
jgi:hypothetical protein